MATQRNSADCSFSKVKNKTRTIFNQLCEEQSIYKNGGEMEREMEKRMMQKKKKKQRTDINTHKFNGLTWLPALELL